MDLVRRHRMHSRPLWAVTSLPTRNDLAAERTASTGAGIAFYALVERPMLGSGVRAILEPPLMSNSWWADQIYVSPTRFRDLSRRLFQHLALARRAFVP